ncbi:hypothetical protein CLG96_14580 [Sphingomonas oleivorans]|uniref:Endonuclease n=1 Tax=Sphingomonas oleivorans TaxID=1735121 RepID=A0A2T5FVE5_9SPHN|nr:hypothetical protein [Sphingomonas oleivorans]PTQ09418.1 hypothetical protein CLG96_14580 [Sphingomonas oleivorans]
MFKPIVPLVAGITLSALAVASGAEARQFNRSASVSGADGHGYSRSRQASRQSGNVSASRNLQTNDGRGINSSRTRTYADGNYSAGATHRLNDGRSFGRSLDVNRNEDGSTSYTGSRTGLDGETHTISGTLDRDAGK